jgi:DedD protein
MERKLLERMLGAAALVAALVVLGPLLLDGNRNSLPRRDGPAAGGSAEELQTHTVTLQASGRLRPTSVSEDRAVSRTGIAPGLPTPVSGTATEQQPAPAPARPATAPEPMGARVPAPRPTSVGDATAPAIDTTKTTRTGDTGAGRPVQAAKAAPVAASSEAWAVQVGTFGERANAERLTRQLTERGFAAFLSPFSRGGKIFFRVRVGPAHDRASAAELARQLATAGHAGPVVAN